MMSPSWEKSVPQYFNAPITFTVKLLIPYRRVYIAGSLVGNTRLYLVRRPNPLGKFLAGFLFGNTQSFLVQVGRHRLRQMLIDFVDVVPQFVL